MFVFVRGRAIGKVFVACACTHHVLVFVYVLYASPAVCMILIWQRGMWTHTFRACSVCLRPRWLAKV